MDGVGNRLLFATWPSQEGGYPTFLQMLVNDEEGIKHSETRRVSRDDLTARLHGFEEQLAAGVAFAEVEPDYGRFLLHQIADKMRQQRRQTPTGYPDLLALLGEPNETYTQIPVWQHISPDSLLQDTELNGSFNNSFDNSSDDLFALPWFEMWFLDVERVKTYAIIDIKNQTIKNQTIKNQTIKNQIVGLTDNSNISYPTEPTQEIVTQAVEEVFDVQMAVLYQQRLENSADILYRRGEMSAARQALRHALILNNTLNTILNSHGTFVNCSFATTLVRRSIQVALEMLNADYKSYMRNTAQTE